jgi:alpha-tubulin suppressor-like RCC1 family protein
MADRFPGGVISKTPPTVVAPVAGEGGSASGMWTLDTVLEYEKAGAWPKPVLPREFYVWGENGGAALNDSSVNRSSPTQVGALTNWAQVFASPGSTSFIAITTEGRLYSSGGNASGRVGDGTTITSSSPVQIGALTNWAQADAADVVSVAIKTDGTLWAWGYNGTGQIGDNTVVSKSSPVQIGALTNWAQVSTGNNPVAAIKTDGTLWAWGRGVFGRDWGRRYR